MPIVHLLLKYWKWNFILLCCLKRGALAWVMISNMALSHVIFYFKLLLILSNSFHMSNTWYKWLWGFVLYLWLILCQIMHMLYNADFGRTLVDNLGHSFWQDLLIWISLYFHLSHICNILIFWYFRSYYCQ